MICGVDKSVYQRACESNGIPVELFEASWSSALQQYAGVATQDSIARCVSDAAVLGVLPSLQQALPVPRRDKTRGITEVQCFVTARGMMAIMSRSEQLIDIDVQLVHVKDSYELKEDGVFVHRYDPFDPEREIVGNKDIKGAYIKFLFRNGHVKYHFLPVSRIEKARQCARRDEIWNQWYREMCMKTIIRDAFARGVVPIEPVIATAIQRVIDVDDIVLDNSPDRVTIGIDNGNGNGNGNDHQAPAPAGPVAEYSQMINDASTIMELNRIVIQLNRDPNVRKEARQRLNKLAEERRRQIAEVAQDENPV